MWCAYPSTSYDTSGQMLERNPRMIVENFHTHWLRSGSDTGSSMSRAPVQEQTVEEASTCRRCQKDGIAGVKGAGRMPVQSGRGRPRESTVHPGLGG